MGYAIYCDAISDEGPAVGRVSMTRAGKARLEVEIGKATGPYHPQIIVDVDGTEIWMRIIHWRGAWILLEEL